MLGLEPGERALIVTCDDLGLCHAANMGIFRALREGIATSASLMVPAPWARDAAARHRGEDVGVHLTLNAEYDTLRWGPITVSPSLLDGDGGFPRQLDDLWDHADVEEVARECRTQIERAILWGFDVTHLSSHLGALTMRPEFFDVYLELAEEFRLPVRLPPTDQERLIGFPARKVAAERGVLSADHVVRLRRRLGAEGLERLVMDLQPGVTEMVVHPAVDTPELRSFCPDWATRVEQWSVLVESGDLEVMLSRAGVRLLGFRELRDALRRET
ncbi:MAG: carbohydrate deacetylase [Acidimicrobiales bacterium]|nr:MAG: carbohydrate deacetylase [Acidimicrobiales bacterium]